MSKLAKFLLIGLLLAPNLALAGPKLSVFDCGRIAVPDVSRFGLSPEATDVRVLFVPCYLIEHAEGRLLWDAGLPLAMVGPRDPDSNAWYDRSLLDQLRDMQLTPADIEYVAFSHFHYDHVGAANAFSGSTLLIQDTEHAAAFANPESNPVYQPPLYSGLREADHRILDGDHDVFGDGSVRIISAPGHTAGHQVLLLELDNFGPLMLSGDLYHFEASRRLRATPEFNTDAAETLRSMDKVEALVRETGATFWIEHSLELAESLNLAPAFYD